MAIATLILAATAAALVGVRWALSAKSRLFQSGFNAEGNAAALRSADAALAAVLPPAADTWRPDAQTPSSIERVGLRLADLQREERRECAAYI